MPSKAGGQSTNANLAATSSSVKLSDRWKGSECSIAAPRRVSPLINEWRYVVRHVDSVGALNRGWEDTVLMKVPKGDEVVMRVSFGRT